MLRVSNMHKNLCIKDISKYGFDDYVKDYICTTSKYSNYFYSNIDDSLSPIASLKSIVGDELFLLLADMFMSFRNRLFKVDVVSGLKSNHPAEIVYDFKHGWTLITNDGPAFLGKIDICEPENISIGIYSYFSGMSTIDGSGKVIVGSYCSIASDQYIFSLSRNHPYQYPSTYNFKSNSRIEKYKDNFSIQFLPTKHENDGVIVLNDVWIGRNCTIMNGVTIANGCVIGANATVTNNTVPYGIYVGSPAKLIKLRYPQDIIDVLEKICWWNWSLSKIKKNYIFFDLDLRACSVRDLTSSIV